MSDRKSLLPALWLFALLRIPYGVFTGFIRTPLPYLLRSEGIPVDQIANILSFVSLPAALYFLWSPLVDFWLRRRSWLVLSSILSGTILFVTIAQPFLGAPWIIKLMTFGFAINLLTSAASGGLIATTLPALGRTKASGWYQAGSLGAGTLAGGLILLLAQHLSKVQVGWVALALTGIPALSALTLSESPPSRVRGRFAQELRQMGKEITSTFWSRKSVMGLFLMIAPIGTGAATSLFAGMAPDYHVDATQVAWLNGIGGGLILAVGALLGGMLPARWDRRVAYVVAGALNALVSVFLWVAPVTPASYFLGLAFYLLTTGLCYASFTALVFYLLGDAGRSISSRYTVLVSLSTVPIIYMTWLEGRGYQALGMRSVAAIDAIGNLVIVAIFFIYWVKSSRTNRSS
jgi:PAT family beta-lactamase induction signal transducer AmpG